MTGAIVIATVLGVVLVAFGFLLLAGGTRRPMRISRSAPLHFGASCVVIACGLAALSLAATTATA